MQGSIAQIAALGIKALSKETSGKKVGLRGRLSTAVNPDSGIA
jgi:hypothetical protein